jgi:hypothetical protein
MNHFIIFSVYVIRYVAAKKLTPLSAIHFFTAVLLCVKFCSYAFSAKQICITVGKH